MVKNGIKVVKEEVMLNYNLYPKLYNIYIKEGLEKYGEDLFRRVKRGVYWISTDIIDDVFSRRRRPNRTSNQYIKEYVLKESFSYVGCIRPPSMTEKECVSVIEYVFKKLVENTNSNYLTLYYFIEKNGIQKKELSSSQYHIHFLIQTDIVKGFCQIGKSVIKEYLGGLPFLQVYNNKRWEVEGKSYVVKDVTKDSKLGYLVYNKKK